MNFSGFYSSHSSNIDSTDSLIFQQNRVNEGMGALLHLHVCFNGAKEVFFTYTHLPTPHSFGPCINHVDKFWEGGYSNVIITTRYIFSKSV